MGRKLIDISGQRFERLVVIRYARRISHSSSWLCRCDCGKEVEVARGGLISGETKSCGCFRRDRMARLTLKHGERGGVKRARTSAEYRCWSHMIERCSSPQSHWYKWYGAVGITVCARWRDFANFLADMGERPNGLTIERIDSKGNYEPGNCRWATMLEQARNRSNNRIVEFKGQKVPLSEAAEMAGIRYASVKSRIQKGWTVIDALTEPINEQRRRAAQSNHGGARRHAASAARRD